MDIQDFDSMGDHFLGEIWDLLIQIG